MDDEIEYYTRRAAEERLAAARARSPVAEQRHRILAERYAQRVREREVTGTT